MSFLLSEDAALKSYVTGLTVSDEKNANRSVGVWFGYPDVEIRSQAFPFITIDLLDITPALNRQHSGVMYDADNQGTQQPVSNGARLYSYESPMAYDLIYQVSSYSRHPRHDRALAAQLLRKFPGFRGFLPVNNDKGNDATGYQSVTYRHMFLDNYTKIDRAEGENGNKRILRNIYTVRVVSEMTPATAQAALYSVQTVSINNNGAQYPWEITNPDDLTLV